LENLEEKTICPKCGSIQIIKDFDAGEEVCGECGLVISNEIIDRGPEWRAFTLTENTNRSRGGLTSTLFWDQAFSTGFYGNKDASGHRLDPKIKAQMNRLRRYDTRSKFDDTWRRNLSIAMAELDRMCVLLNIPKNVKEKAANIYREALKADLIRGRSIDSFVAASIHAACRVMDLPRPLKKICEASTRDYFDITQNYRILIRDLKLRMPLDTPNKFIPEISAKLKLSRKTEEKAAEIIRSAQLRKGVSGKDPRGVAAAALYMASIENGEYRLQRDVAIAAGMTEVTLRNRQRGLESTLDMNHLMPSLPIIQYEITTQ